MYISSSEKLQNDSKWGLSANMRAAGLDVEGAIWHWMADYGSETDVLLELADGSVVNRCDALGMY